MRIPRTSLHFVAVVTFFAAATTTAVVAQDRQIFISSPGEVVMPGLPGGRPLKTGTGRITGRVVAAETGTPLRRAQVRITGPDIGMKTSLTDAEGRYEFKELPAGRFTVSASKSGFVGVQYGQSRPFEQGRPIELSEKQVLDKADINMPRGSVISGRIVDEFGEPVADAMVTAMRQSWMGGRRRLVSAGRSAQTNDLGQFRMYGLPPGEYYVSATLRNMESMMFDVMGPSGGPTGSNPASGYAPTYFPGTSSPTEAEKITIAVGQEAQQTDFALMPVKLARISGMVMSSDGKPVESAMINVVPVKGAGDIGAMMMTASARTTKEGQFTVNGVAPGEYMLNVRSLRISPESGGAMVFTATIGGPGGDDSEFAAMPVAVAGEDLNNVVVVTAKGASATGRLSFEGTAKPTNITGIRITAMPADTGDGPMMMVGGGGGIAKADGTFELKGISGHRIIRAVNLPQGWMLKAVRAGGADVTDTGIEFKPGEAASNIEIVTTSKTTEVNGGVTATDGTAVKEFTVVIFSDDPGHWALPMSRWISGARPDQEGRFKVRNMPAGSYYAAAVDYLEAGAWSDPELLERLKTNAKRFTLADGEVETLDLKITQ